mmetsp:Transcript_7468/g.13261  ORF Transcript_7468/g.13261 Transcript_7468/m.13261 type:complete len:148 (-) Transcript_7468:281-724(-)|eukprot:CAMPEP_0184692136 /NCGR_PEP_ID=MMETSP0313-20130426/741_1 /TAXON_ID=2792 /ORGANISM="Porphyridium aerugineum, Strain SAG 1380-2" /LENGTH=147 /DNA_ID=CAMNT_0027149945 /DNA_START=70 /DNA_END=513 /DNA_ORIENTATION=-
MAFIGSSVSVVKSTTSQKSVCSLRMSAEQPVTRRDVVAGAAAMAAAFVFSSAANADIEYANVGFLGGSDVIDINNANVRVYQKYPGLYPKIAAEIVSHGPYESVADLYKLDLSEGQKETLKKYEKNLTALPVRPEYAIDRINNGLYR